MSPTKRITERLKYTLSDGELRHLGDDLARAIRENIRVENDKKTAMAHYAMLQKESIANLADLSLKITNGYEWREIDCVVQLSTPRSGLKRIIRSDTNEVVREEPMTPAEMQAAFDFDAGKKPQ